MLFRNTLAHSAGLVVTYALSFILAPVMLAQLGLELFGIWAVTGALAMYAGLMDLGVTRSVERFVAMRHARKDDHGVAEVLTLGVLVLLAVSAVAAGATVVVAPLIHGGLGDAITLEDLRVVLLCSVAIFGLNALRSVLNGVVDGMLRMVVSNTAVVVYGIFSFALSLAALLISPDLVTYGLANVAAGVAGLVASLVAVRHVWPGWRLVFPSWSTTREVLSFGLKSQVMWISEIVNLQADKVIIAFLIDVRAAGAFEIANRAVLAVRTVAIMSTSAIVPTAAAQITREGRRVIADFYRRYTTRCLGISLPAMILPCVIAPALLLAWLGDVPDGSVLIFVGLTLIGCMTLSVAVANTLTLAEGRPGLLALVATFSATVNILATLALVPALGLWGVIAGSAIGILTGDLVFLRVFHRSHGLPASVYLRAVARPALLCAVASLPVLIWLLGVGAPDGGRPEALAHVAVMGLLFVGVYWPVASRLDLLPSRLQLPRFRRTAPRSA